VFQVQALRVGAALAVLGVAGAALATVLPLPFRGGLSGPGHSSSSIHAQASEQASEASDPTSRNPVATAGSRDQGLVKSIAKEIGPGLLANRFPSQVQLKVEGRSEQTVAVDYTIDWNAQREMQRLINLYRPDYASFVAIDASTGRVLVMISSSRVDQRIGNMTLQARFPAASIFKVVTAAAAIDSDKAHPGTVVPFNGANHTLYRRNVKETRENRWTRYMTLREAFARSVNTYFGKLGLFYVGPEKLADYATRFQFNQDIVSDMPIERAETNFGAEDPWSVVTAASGFTRETTMSPLQGALIAAAVANDGVMMTPSIVGRAMSADGGLVYEHSPQVLSAVVDPSSAEELRELFGATVERGTSRRYFRRTLRKTFWDDVEFGGKTGSLTGMSPRGKNDWFVGYARFRDTRIAVAALTVNQRKWRVKSSTLANEFLTRYLKDIVKEQNDASSRPSQPARRTGRQVANRS
jgi:cell division protein FtsI/penicillin-binding protein 2